MNVRSRGGMPVLHRLARLEVGTVSIPRRLEEHVMDNILPTTTKSYFILSFWRYSEDNILRISRLTDGVV